MSQFTNILLVVAGGGGGTGRGEGGCSLVRVVVVAAKVGLVGESKVGLVRESTESRN